MKKWSVYLAVALVSAGVLIDQLALTRIFSATLYYHFAFLAISIALFGSGAGGVVVYLARERIARYDSAVLLSALGIAFSVTTAAALAVHLQSSFSLNTESENYWRLFGTYAAAAIPLFFAGALIALAVTRYADDIGRLYLFDLGGAAAGCVLLIPLLNRFGAVNTILLVALLASVAATILAFAGSQRSLRAAAAILSVAVFSFFAWNAATNAVDVRRVKSVEESNLLFAKWNSLSRVSVTGRLTDPRLLLAIDAGASTHIFRDAGRLDRWGNLRRDVSALVYVLRPGGETLIIGPGGGTDVMNARASRQRKITAVELNPIIARDVMSSEPFRSYAASLYQQPNVELIVDEGRSFIRRSHGKYDVIQATMVDTWAATAAGAFALAENNIYTVEAFNDYLDHLAPGGVLSMTRWYLEPPDQTARLVSLARVALERSGASDPGAHVILVKSHRGRAARTPATLLVKRMPFTPAEVERVERIAERNRFEILYTPRTRPKNIFTDVLNARDVEQVWGQWPANITPTFDNNPFFFNTLRPSQLGLLLDDLPESRQTNLGTVVLFWLIAISAVMVLAFIVGPLAIARREAIAGDTGRKIAALLYFVCLGAGFILIEVTLTQKFVLFLGHPVYALVVVLFSLLLFSGIGSALSPRFAGGDLRKAIARMAAAIVLLVLIGIAAASPLFYRLVHLPTPARIAITVALIAPIGLLMGMPMPTGIRLLARERPEIIAWAWGLNGAASVMGSVLALAFAILTGFNQALALGGVFYVLAILAIRRSGVGEASVFRERCLWT